MNSKRKLHSVLAASTLVATLLPTLSTCLAQGTAFLYQGRLNTASGQATGTYDLTFTLFNTNVTGAPVSGTVTNAATFVSNGLFTLAVDFGGAPFTLGQPLWLEIGARTNGAASFSLLAPRQAVLSAPSAIYAESANATNLVGTIPTANLSGAALLAGGNVFTGEQSVTGGNVGIGTTTPTTALQVNGTVTATSFSGDGGGLTDLSSSSLVGLIPAAAIGAGSITASDLVSATNWFPFTIANPTPASGDFFGGPVAAVGSSQVLIGAPYKNTGAGTAYLFSTNGTLLTTYTNPAPVPGAFELFGNSVAAVESSQVLIGAPDQSDDDGAAYLFSTDGTLLTTFTNPLPASGSDLGYAVAAVGSSQVLIGAPNKNTGVGTAYLFSTNGTLQTTFTNPLRHANAYFGSSAAAVGSSQVLIGAFGASGTNFLGGAAYLFNTNGTLVSAFTDPTTTGAGNLGRGTGNFGYSLRAVGGGLVLIGAPAESTADGADAGVGAAYLFSTDGTLLTAFTNPTPASSSYFGNSVAAVGSSQVLIGAEGQNGRGMVGAAYLFSTNGTLLAAFPNPTPASGDYFGCSVAAVGSSQVLIGANGLNGEVGAAYLFSLQAYNPGLVAATVSPLAISTTSLADGAVTADKIGGVLFPSQIPNLEASQITSGTLADALLSTNVALRAGGNTFNGNQIVANGNVGIGTATPRHKLDVNGNMFFGTERNGAIFNELGDTLYLGAEQKYLGNTLLSPVSGSTDWINLMANPISAGIMFGLAGPTTTNPHTNITALMVIRASGNVGIGTSTPAATLEVSGNAQIDGVLTATSFAGSGSGLTALNATNLVGTIPAADLSGVAWRAGGNAFTGNQTVASGSVGIGTTTPANLLDVQGSADFTGKVGIGTNSPGYALQVVGQIESSGPVAGFYFLDQNNNTDTWEWLATSGGASLYNSAYGGKPWTVQTNGNVGIGTTTPAGHLTVVTANGTVSLTDDTFTPDLVMSGGPAPGILRVRNGLEIWPNTNATTPGTFNVRNTSGVATISLTGANGSVTASNFYSLASIGIGTTTPTKGALEIDLTANGETGYTSITAVEGGGVAFPANEAAGAPASIWAGNNIFAAAFWAFSDERVKHLIGQSDSAADLKTLLAIKVADYTYKDTIGKGNRPQKKVIAQQVEKIYPQAVSQSRGEVPDIYKRAAIQEGWVQLATDLKVGERVKLITAERQGVYRVLEVRDGAFRTNFKPATGNVFVFGREVDDFRTVDYEALTTLNLSATQELARKLDAQQAALNKLQDKLNQTLAEKETLLKHLAVLEARDQAREDRLARLESSVEKGSAHGSYAALNQQ